MGNENLASSTNSLLDPQNKKYVGKGEFIAYLAAVFFYTNMTGMIGSFKNAYLVDVLKLTDHQASIYNVLLNVLPFVFNFFIAIYIDRRDTTKGGKFKPIITICSVPLAATLILSFWTPKALTGTLMMIYLVTVGLLFAVFNSTAATVNMAAFVLTPNNSERDTIISFKSISSAVGNSAPLVIVFVLDLIFKDNAALQYIIAAALSGVVGVITMMIGGRVIQERIAYNPEKKNPLMGFASILTNKYALIVILSEMLKNFRQISNYMGPFLAAALLGSTGKFLLFGLPTGIGTAIGMLAINFLLKKFNSKVLYIASSIYSIIMNTIAFGVGYMYFTNPSSVLQIVFIVFLFLIGLQFGASNLLPAMFQADVLEDIELKTGKRMDATLPFVISIGTLISSTIAQYFSPKILYGDSKVGVIGYIQGNGDNQSLETKIWLLAFYTIVQGLFMFIGAIPFFFYKLTGKTKEEVHNAVLAKRAELEKSNSSIESDNINEDEFAN